MALVVTSYSIFLTHHTLVLVCSLVCDLCLNLIQFFHHLRGSKDGDVCVVEVKKMEISHWSKRLHLGSCIASLEFCPSER